MGDGIQVGSHFEEIEREFVQDPIGRFTGYALLFHVLLFGGIIGFAYLEAPFLKITGAATTMAERSRYNW